MTHTLSVPQATPAASSKPRGKQAGGPRERAAKPGHAARPHRKRMAAHRSRRAPRQTAHSGRRSDERRPRSRLRLRVPTQFETPSEPRVKRPKAARTSGPNAATLKQRFPSRSREGPNRVPFARAGSAATCPTFRAASEAAEGRENERSQRGHPQAAFPLALARGPQPCSVRTRGKRSHLPHFQSREWSGRRPRERAVPMPELARALGISDGSSQTGFPVTRWASRDR